MSDTASSPSLAATILWPLALVAAVHLSTTPGQWLLTDHAEYILVADRLIERGSLHLSEPGEGRRAELPWVPPAPPGEPQRSRLLPLTSIALIPFALADRVLEPGRPPADRPLVHLQGHVFVLAGLGLMGIAVAHQGATVAGIATAVVLTGFTWPVWQVSRRGGTEGLFIFLVAVFLLGHARTGDGARTWGVVLMSVACALLPWGNPTGAILAGALLLGAGAERWWTGQHRRPLALPLAAWIASGAAVVVVWNYGYHGDWLLGGYASYLGAPRSIVDAQALVGGLGLHLGAMAKEGGPLLAVAGAGVLAGNRRDRAALFTPLSLVAAMLLVFAAFPQPDPTRRLAAAWPAWGVAVGRTIGQLHWTLSVRQAVLALGAVVGFHGFWITEGRYFAGPGGLFYPSVLWVRLWIASAPAWRFLLPGIGLLAIIVVAAGRTSRLLAVDDAATRG